MEVPYLNKLRQIDKYKNQTDYYIKKEIGEKFNIKNVKNKIY